MLTVACVFKSYAGTMFGHAYDATWVQKLASGVARHLTVAHRFVCLTNMGEIEGVETIPLSNDWSGWWSKLEMFRPGLFDGPVLSFDLDVLFTGNIDHMAGPFDSLVMLHDVVPGVRNSTCMWWDARNPLYGVIYETFAADPVTCMNRHAVWNQQSMGDQGMIADLMRAADHPIRLWQDLFGAHRYVHFSAFSRLNPEMQDEATTPDPFSYLNQLKAPSNPMIERDRPMVYCLGAPKFPLFPHLSVVNQNWR